MAFHSFSCGKTCQTSSAHQTPAVCGATLRQACWETLPVPCFSFRVFLCASVAK